MLRDPRTPWVLVAVLAVVAALGLARTQRGGGDQPLFVYVGAGFRLPVEEAAGRFREETGIPVELSFAGSGCLLAQAHLSQRGDLYMPGETFFMAQAEARGMIEDATDVALMWPVILVPRGNPAGIATLASLARPGLRLGFGDPEATACGIAARELVDASEVATEIRRNQVMAALNVNELGTAVALGALDAALAWDATADLFDRDVQAIAVTGARPTTIPLGVLTFSRQKERARRLVEFMARDDGGLAVFRRHGYDLPAAPGIPPVPTPSPESASLPAGAQAP